MNKKCFRMTRLARALAVMLPLAAFAPGVAAAAPGTQLEIEFTRNSLANADFGDARLGGTEHRIAICGAPLQQENGEFRWALDYAYQRYEYSGLASRNRDLHRLALPLSWHGDVRLPWMIEFRPVVASSSNVFKEFWSRGDSEDFMWHGRAALERPPVGMSWGWRLGAARDDVFGRERFYPVLALLRQHEAVHVELGWPFARAMREAGPGIEAGGELAPAGARWHVVSDERNGASFDYAVRAWRAGAILRWRSAGGLVLTTRLGLEFERRHRLEDDMGSRVSRTVGEARYFELAAGYRW